MQLLHPLKKQQLTAQLGSSGERSGGAEVKRGLLQKWVEPSGSAMNFTSLTLRWALCSHSPRGMELGVSEQGRNAHIPFFSWEH